MKKMGLIILLLAGSTASAMSLDWTGNYRFEYIEIDNPSLSSGSRKGYVLNQLWLSPKIVASDGYNIVSKFHLLSNGDADYANSQVGQIWGPGVNSVAPASGTNSDNSNVLSQQQPQSTIKVSELYLNINQEFGSIVVGRAPNHFGLGITHNAGQGKWDHWYDNRDMIGYKFYNGYLSMMPSIGKVYDNRVEQGYEVTDQTFVFEYDNTETGNLLGLYYETRTGVANDAPDTEFGGTGASVQTRFASTSYNIILGKKYTNLDFKIEGAFQSGSTGVKNSTGSDVRLNGFAVVADFNYLPNETKSKWNFKFGSVSGDDPSTEDFEGYILDRNYDVAFMLFNHRLGQFDIFKTALSKSGTKTATNSMDDEGISNVMFISPTWTFDSTDKSQWRVRVTWAQLTNSDFNVGAGIEKIGADIGTEWDLAYVYKAHENMEWRNEVGLFSPGSAFKGGSMDLDTKSVIGFQSSAAISF